MENLKSKISNILDHPVTSFFMSALSGSLVIVFGSKLLKKLDELLVAQNILSQTEVWANLGWMALFGLAIYFISILFQLANKHFIDWLYKKWFSKKKK